MRECAALRETRRAEEGKTGRREVPPLRAGIGRHSGRDDSWGEAAIGAGSFAALPSHLRISRMTAKESAGDGSLGGGGR